MTRGEREAVRVLIDRRRRMLVADDVGRACRGCGADGNAHTAGCKQCGERHRSRARNRRAAA